MNSVLGAWSRGAGLERTGKEHRCLCWAGLKAVPWGTSLHHHKDEVLFFSSLLRSFGLYVQVSWPVCQVSVCTRTLPVATAPVLYIMLCTSFSSKKMSVVLTLPLYFFNGVVFHHLAPRSAAENNLS